MFSAEDEDGTGSSVRVCNCAASTGSAGSAIGSIGVWEAMGGAGDVSAENIVGKEGEGFKVAMRALDGGRINIATCSVGGAAFCVDAALQYCKERQQFGRSIADFQYLQFKLADMATSVQASRLMVQRAARSFDEGLSSTTVDAAMAKRFATDTCYNVAKLSCTQVWWILTCISYAIYFMF